MSALRHLLISCRPGIALILAVLVTASSFCPRGWFICLHEDMATLVGIDHVSEHSGAECPVGDAQVGHDDGCLDLALSLIGDLQVHCVPHAPILPEGDVLAVLPGFALLAQTRSLPPPAWTGEPPPTPLVHHDRLQV